MAIIEDKKFAFIQAFQENMDFPGAKLSKIDGVRADFIDGWGLVRASNTGPYLTLRFEADNSTALKRIQTQFRNALLAMDPHLKLPF